jgi:hypothetical protein
MGGPAIVMTPEEFMLFFVDSYEAWKFWVSKPDRDKWALISMLPDIESGGWIIPSVQDR